MKNFKINIGLFSLIAILAVSVFFTSCEQDTQIASVQEIDRNVLLEGKYYLTPPSGYDEEMVIEYLDNATDSQIQKMIENYRITNFLLQTGQFWQVKSNLSFGKHISDVDLSKYLTIQQLESLANYQPSIIDERGCCVTHPLYGTSCWGCSPPICFPL